MSYYIPVPYQTDTRESPRGTQRSLSTVQIGFAVGSTSQVNPQTSRLFTKQRIRIFWIKATEAVWKLTASLNFCSLDSKMCREKHSKTLALLLFAENAIWSQMHLKQTALERQEDFFYSSSLSFQGDSASTSLASEMSQVCIALLPSQSS